MNSSDVIPVGAIQTPLGSKKAAGILPFFDNGKTVLLGKEFRDRYNAFFWMCFGGKNEEGETLVQTAVRETSEETAFTLNASLEQVQEAEEKGHFVDFYNKSTNFFYRMYCIKFENKIDLDVTIEQAKLNNDHVEKVGWNYFNALDVIFSEDGSIPETSEMIYSTELVRYKLLRNKGFFINEFI